MIAISYRREDSLPITGRLYDHLQAKFGRHNVFMDFDSIPPGVDFREKIKETIERSSLVIAVIGPRWIGEQSDGSRRIDDPVDVVRLELEHAASRGIPIVPLLVNNTAMPRPEALPSTLQWLAFRNALPLDTGIDFHNHTDRLIHGITDLVQRDEPRNRLAWLRDAKLKPPRLDHTRKQEPPRVRTGLPVLFTLFVILLLGLGVFGWRTFMNRQPRRVTQAPPTNQAVALSQPTAQATNQPSPAISSSPNVAPIQSEPTATALEKMEVVNGSVKITSAPSGAAVVADGREIGQTPLIIEDVKPGQAAFDLRLQGFKTASVSGEVKSQQQTFLAARLEKATVLEPGPQWTNSLGMKFVELGGIRVSVWETRVQDYDAFCKATGHHHDAADFDQDATHPVVKVNWSDANAFCKWLTDKERGESLLEQGQAYRLPSDLEWSMAVGLPEESGATPEARDGKIKNEFPWGKQWPPPNGSGNYADQSAKRGVTTVIANYVDNFAHTSPVGSFKPNQFGIYDLGGNVWEWCDDSYKGSGAAAGRDWGVLRGGSWGTSNRSEIQSSYRNVVDRNEADVTYGFRCVIAPEDKTAKSEPSASTSPAAQ
jgi:formylglycine-generating enzyme required for sulfatase activity